MIITILNRFEPSISMGHLYHGYVSHITKGYIYLWIPLILHCRGATWETMEKRMISWETPGEMEETDPSSNRDVDSFPGETLGKWSTGG